MNLQQTWPVDSSNVNKTVDIEKLEQKEVWGEIAISIYIHLFIFLPKLKNKQTNVARKCSRLQKLFNRRPKPNANVMYEANFNKIQQASVCVKKSEFIYCGLKKQGL